MNAGGQPWQRTTQCFNVWDNHAEELGTCSYGCGHICTECVCVCVNAVQVCQPNFIHINVSFYCCLLHSHFFLS